MPGPSIACYRQVRPPRAHVLAAQIEWCGVRLFGKSLRAALSRRQGTLSRLWRAISTRRRYRAGEAPRRGRQSSPLLKHGRPISRVAGCPTRRSQTVPAQRSRSLGEGFDGRRLHRDRYAADPDQLQLVVTQGGHSLPTVRRRAGPRDACRQSPELRGQVWNAVTWRARERAGRDGTLQLAAELVVVVGEQLFGAVPESAVGPRGNATGVQYSEARHTEAALTLLVWAIESAWVSWRLRTLEVRMEHGRDQWAA